MPPKAKAKARVVKTKRQQLIDGADSMARRRILKSTEIAQLKTKGATLSAKRTGRAFVENYNSRYPERPVSDMVPATKMVPTPPSKWVDKLKKQTEAEGVLQRATECLGSIEKLMWGKACRIMACVDSDGVINWAVKCTEDYLIERCLPVRKTANGMLIEASESDRIQARSLCRRAIMSVGWKQYDPSTNLRVLLRYADYWVDISRAKPVVHDEESLNALSGNFVVISEMQLALGVNWPHAALTALDGAAEWMRILRRAFCIDDQLPKLRERLGEAG
jgi:hypothetical protein